MNKGNAETLDGALERVYNDDFPFRRRERWQRYAQFRGALVPEQEVHMLSHDIGCHPSIDAVEIEEENTIASPILQNRVE
jgi:hypothetical protein